MTDITGAKGDAPTINDVAALAGVSKKTVSRVINKSPLLTEATRSKVEDAIRRLGFVPNPQARALALRRNFLIVLLHDNPNAQTVLNFQKGVLQTISDSDLALVVRPVDRGSDAMLEDVRTFLEMHRPLGVLILPPISERDDLAQLCRESGVEYVRVGSAPLDDSAHCIASNDREVVLEACSALIAAGHRRFGFVRGPEGFRSALEREEGFRDAMSKGSIAIDDVSFAQGNYRFETGIAAGNQLLMASPRPTAIFASNDEMAAGVMHAAKAHGIEVPKELSIVGFDDSPTASHLWPPLSTVRWPIVEMGRIAARKLVSRYLPETEDDQKDLPTQLPSTFIDRGSVAPPSD